MVKKTYRIKINNLASCGGVVEEAVILGSEIFADRIVIRV